MVFEKGYRLSFAAITDKNADGIASQMCTTFTHENINFKRKWNN